MDALPRIVLPSDLIIPPLLFVIDTPSELNKLIALETFVEIVPELFISNSPPSVDIVFAAVDVTDEPECIVSIVPAVSLSVFFIAFWPVLSTLPLFVIVIWTSSAVTTCWFSLRLEIVLSAPTFSAFELTICKNKNIPVLQKDFIFDIYQIYEGALNGASAALVIVSILDEKELNEIIKTCHKLSITPLVEIFNESELNLAINNGAELIGINNRNLNNLKNPNPPTIVSNLKSQALSKTENKTPKR